MAGVGSSRRGNLTYVGGNRDPAELDETPAKILEPTSSGTSIFDPVLCELVYRWFSPAGGAVLDPFAGGSVRGLVASRLGRRYAGVELRAEQVAANRAQLALAGKPRPVWHCGDARDTGRLCAGYKADLVFSCPPYADLERYSDDPADLSAMPYDAFLAAYRAIIAAALALLKPDRFACFVVGDVRAPDGYYRGLPGDTIAAFAAAGARLYNDAVLITAVGSLPLRAGKAFTAARKLGKAHQNVLVFCNGDPRKAAAACGPVEIAHALGDAGGGEGATGAL